MLLQCKLQLQLREQCSIEKKLLGCILHYLMHLLRWKFYFNKFFCFSFLVVLNLEFISFVLQVAIKIIYTTIQTVICVMTLYSMIGYEWKASKFLSFYYYITKSYVYFILYGMMVIAPTPGHQIVVIFMSFFLSFWNLFFGFLISRPVHDLNISYPKIFK